MCMKIRNKWLAWTIIAALVLGMTQTAFGVEQIEFGTVEFGSDTVWEAGNGVNREMTELMVVTDGDGEDVLHVERDLSAGGDTIVLIKANVMNTENINKMNVRYRTLAPGWFQTIVTLLDENKNELTSGRIAGDSNYVSPSTSFSRASVDISGSATVANAAYIQLNIRGFNSGNSTSEACHIVEFDYIQFIGDEVSCMEQNEKGTFFTFDYNSSIDGWSFDGDAVLEDGAMVWETAGGTAAMTSRAENMGIAAEEHSNISLKFQNGTAAERAKIYFKTDEMTDFSEEAVFEIPIRPNSETIDTYLINTISNPKWSGTITTMKIIPVDAPGTVRIDEIGILRYPFTVEDTYNALKISGRDNSFGNNRMAIQILKPGFRPEDLIEGDISEMIQWEDEVLAQEDGSFEFEIPMPEVEIREWYYVSIASESLQYDRLIDHRNGDYQNALLNAMNLCIEEQDTQTLETLITDNSDYLQEACSIYGKYVSNKGATALFVGLLAAGGTAADWTELVQKIDDAAILALINTGLNPVEILAEYEQRINMKELAAYTTYEKLTEESKKIAMERIQKKNSQNFAELKDNFSEQVILTTIEKNLGYETIDECLHQNQELLGIDFTVCDKLNNPDKVYQALAGKTLQTLAEVKTAFDNAVAQQKKTEGASGQPSGGFPSSRPGNSGNGITSIGGTPGVSIDKDPDDEDTETTEQFTDLEHVSWAKESILRLYDKKIIAGKTETTFCPNEAITREEFVKILVCALSIPEKETQTFIDVEQEKWYAPYVGGAVTAGIVSGISEDCFGVGEQITRQDICAILYRAAGSPEEIRQGKSFTDQNEIAGYAAAGVAYLSGAGVITGMEDGSFQPKAPATRAQTAVMIEKYLEIVQ